MPPLRLALSQFGAALGDVAANLAHMRGALAAAADAHADAVCCPELSLSGYLLLATDYTDALLDDVERAERVLAADSRRLGVSVVYGAPVRVRPCGLANAVIVQEPDGRRLVYHKTHLVAKEREVFVPGSEFVVSDHGIGLACCYDLAFPEALRVVTLRGASLLLVPMAWEVLRSFVMRPLMTARAIENIVYVAGVNQCGTIGDDLSFSGGSCVVDPLGDALVALDGETGLAIADLDLEWAGRLRDQRDPRTYPLLADRRPELYAAISTKTSANSVELLSQTSVCWPPAIGGDRGHKHA
jgi:predicted amidohydrolase